MYESYPNLPSLFYLSLGNPRNPGCSQRSVYLIFPDAEAWTFSLPPSIGTGTSKSDVRDREPKKRKSQKISKNSWTIWLNPQRKPATLLLLLLLLSNLRFR
uniref:Putative pectin methyltransferase QUA2 n=1 Tax=Rhizophora mucronata TaxID=61149 RepID=A0A2P2M5M8_RHIMU